MDSIGNPCISAYSLPSHTCNTLVMKLRLDLRKSILQLTHIVYMWSDIHSHIHSVWTLLTSGPLSSPHALMGTDLSLSLSHFPSLSLSDGFRRQNPLREQAVLPYKSAKHFLNVCATRTQTHTDFRFKHHVQTPFCSPVTTEASLDHDYHHA